MGYARHSRKDMNIGRDRVTPAAKIVAQLPADYFDTPQELAVRAGRELTILRQARQMRDAWRRGRYGRLRGE